ncbi:hypothetical protein HMPREF9073_00879 [Capnocytophaga sp. oral taxon 326 str. F0382]|nr:hypothetical protein HMPREF9073_00879 [Capnocytophaga sp. oral taxon 326 str. F0382]
MMYNFLYIMTLLVTFQLSAQEKRWQLDSIQSVQQLASDKEKVFGHYQQLYDPQKKVITLLYKYKDEPFDRTKYIYKYNDKDSLLQINKYKTDKGITQLIDSIQFTYTNDTIKKTHFRYLDLFSKKGWEVYEQFKLIRIDGVYYFSKNMTEITAYPYLSFDEENTLEKYFLPPQEIKNEKGQVIERIFNLRDGNFDKYLYTYDTQGNIATIETFEKELPEKMNPTGENSLPFEKEYKLEYEYYPHIPQKEVLDKWQQNKYNRYNDKAIKNIKVHQYNKNEKQYVYQYDLRFYYSEIKQND